MIVTEGINITEIFYQGDSIAEIYQGSDLVFRKKEDVYEYEEYDIVLDWNTRESGSGNKSNLGNRTAAEKATKLMIYLNNQLNRGYSLQPYQEAAPSYITKCSYTDLIGYTDVTSLNNALSAAGFIYGGFTNYVSNYYLTRILRLKIDNKVRDLTEMLFDCPHLNYIYADWDLSSVTSLTNTFKSCGELTTVEGKIKGLSVNISLTGSPLTNKSAMVFIKGLSTVTSTKTISFSYATAITLTEEQKKIATDKGWTIASV